MKKPQSQKTTQPNPQTKNHFIQTKDHFHLSIHEFTPSKPKDDALPVLLVHGLSSSSLSFDLTPSTSLARALSKEGYFVYAINLRGSEKSDRPAPWEIKSWNWTVDTFVENDLNDISEWICERHFKQKLHWIGHSMGGIAYYMTIANQPKHFIHSGITIGSGLDYSNTGSSYESLLKFKKYIRMIPLIPIGLSYKAYSPLTGLLTSQIEKFLAYPQNIETKTFQKLLQKNFNSVPMTLLDQLSTLFETGGILDSNGNSVLKTFHSLDAIPNTLAIGGDMDLQCPPEAVERTIRPFLNSGSKLKMFGLGYGHESHYGHFDLICGKKAPKEVWPEIIGFLNETSLSSVQIKSSPNEENQSHT